jgi:hypothetical protein
MAGSIITAASPPWPSGRCLAPAIPGGQLGSRLEAGHDSASERYVTVSETAWFRAIFNPADSSALVHQTDDNQQIEPVSLAPGMPYGLANYHEGVGKGWSTTLWPCSPRDIMANMRRFLRGQVLKHMDLAVHGWQGKHVQIGPHSHLFGGRVKITSPPAPDDVPPDTLVVLHISDTPARSATSALIKRLETMRFEKKIISFVKNKSSKNVVDIDVKIRKGDFDMLMKKAGPLGRHGLFGMKGTVSTGNAVMFDSNGKLKAYKNELDHLIEWMEWRIPHFAMLRHFDIAMLEARIIRAENISRFLSEVSAPPSDPTHLETGRRPIAQLRADLVARGFDPDPDAHKPKLMFKRDDGSIGMGMSQSASAPPTDTSKGSEGDDNDNDDSDDDISATPKHAFSYLLKIPIGSVTAEKIARTKQILAAHRTDLAVLEKTTPAEMFLTRIDEIEASVEPLKFPPPGKQFSRDTEVVRTPPTGDHPLIQSWPPLEFMKTQTQTSEPRINNSSSRSSSSSSSSSSTVQSPTVLDPRIYVDRSSVERYERATKRRARLAPTDPNFVKLKVITTKKHGKHVGGLNITVFAGGDSSEALSAMAVFAKPSKRGVKRKKTAKPAKARKKARR